MATCKNCFHSYICFSSNGETRYYGKDLACNNVEELCRKYKRKPKLPLTCKDCLHNDACTDMLEALGFKVAGDGYLADERCKTFKNKNNYAEVVRGRWIAGGECNHVPYRIKHPEKWVIYKCSVCGYSNGRKQSNYCPNCGAKVDATEQKNE